VINNVPAVSKPKQESVDIILFIIKFSQFSHLPLKIPNSMNPVENE